MNGIEHYTVGQTGTLWDPTQDVALATITVSAPKFTTSDLSGVTPQYGYFAVFTVTVRNIAPESSGDTIGPSDNDYYVRAAGAEYGLGQVDPGKSQQAEGSSYLGSNVDGDSLDPGQSTTGTVTVDVPSEHGSLVYAPNGTDLGTWSY